MSLEAALGSEVSRLLPRDAEGRLLAPFGSVPKSLLDAAIFDGLVKAGLVNPSETPYRLAVILGVTPARARSLVMAHRLRASRGENAILPDLGELVVIDLATTVHDDREIHFVVEDLLARGLLVDRLRTLGIHTDSSFSSQRIRADRASVLKDWSSIFGFSMDASEVELQLGELKKALHDEALRGGSKRVLGRVTEIGTAFAANFAAVITQLSV